MPVYTNFAPYYDQIFPHRAQTFNFLNSEAGGPGGAILDIGCGTGTYCDALYQSGYQVTGIDLDGGMIDYARSKYPGISFYEKNMMDADSIPGNYDMIFSVGNVVSYLSGQDLSRFLRMIYRMLEPEGKWVFQVVNWDYILSAGVFEFPEIKPADSDLIFLRQYSSVTKEKVIFKTRLSKDEKIIDDDESIMYPFPHQSYIEMHFQAGFRMIGHYGDFQRSPFLENEKNANVFVFQKP